MKKEMEDLKPGIEVAFNLLTINWYGSGGRHEIYVSLIIMFVASESPK